MRLKAIHAFTTGSSRGIGRGLALKLAREGATVAVHYHRNHEAPAEALAEVRELGSDGVIVPGEVTSVDDLRRGVADGHRTPAAASAGAGRNV
jgi:NAD(P)-dependent dehydrogenase (short-subunit alcohol dehydrogenase family)